MALLEANPCLPDHSTLLSCTGYLGSGVSLEWRPIGGRTIEHEPGLVKALLWFEARVVRQRKVVEKRDGLEWTSIQPEYGPWTRSLRGVTGVFEDGPWWGVVYIRIRKHELKFADDGGVTC